MHSVLVLNFDMSKLLEPIGCCAVWLEPDVPEVLEPGLVEPGTLIVELPLELGVPVLGVLGLGIVLLPPLVV